MSQVKIVELDASNTCKLCQNALAKYSCPRCKIAYCSVTCYQSGEHLECSEEFYKNCIAEELAGGHDDEARRTMLEILKRNHNASDQLDSDDDDEVECIADRLAGVDLDDADRVWEKLTEDEQQEFLTFLKSEDVTKLIPPWSPWWSHTCSTVQPLEDLEKYKSQCPTIATIKCFTELSKKTPADCVKFNLINIIAAYAFTARYFNGEHMDFGKEAATCVITLALALKVPQNFEDHETAIKSVEHECTETDWIIADIENFKLLRDDVAKILQGPESSDRKFYILCALSDFRHLLTKALDKKEGGSQFSKNFPNDHFPDVKVESRTKMTRCVKKIDYFLSYAKDILIL